MWTISIYIYWIKAINSNWNHECDILSLVKYFGRNKLIPDFKMYEYKQYIILMIRLRIAWPCWGSWKSFDSWYYFEVGGRSATKTKKYVKELYLLFNCNFAATYPLLRLYRMGISSFIHRVLMTMHCQYLKIRLII